MLFESREEIPGSLFWRNDGRKKRSTKDPPRKIVRQLVAIKEKMISEVKYTIGDYIRLLQAQEEFDREMPRDIEVTWVDALKVQNESER